jgi:hypothetical protein
VLVLLLWMRDDTSLLARSASAILVILIGIHMALCIAIDGMKWWLARERK